MADSLASSSVQEVVPLICLSRDQLSKILGSLGLHLTLLEVVDQLLATNVSRYADCIKAESGAV